MKKRKIQSTKEFAEEQLREIKTMNQEIKKKTRKLILLAVAANIVLMVLVFVFIWYIQNR